ncbi:MAG: glycosyltransferase family 39 protein [Caldilineaceae bacterium]
MSTRDQLQRLSLLGALLVGFGLRHFHLGAESLWYDETVSVYLAQKSIPAMLAHTAGDIHPPGYYLLLHFWQLLAHPTPTHGLEFLYAWPSLFFGQLLIVLIYVLGRKLLNRNSGLIAAWLTAIHPFHLWYSQEVRMYTLGAFLGLICLWALLQLSDRNRLDQRSLQWLIVYVVSAVTGMYTLYYFLFLLVALNLLALFLLLRQGRLLLSWLAGQLGVLLLWAPWLPIFIHQATDPPVPPWRVPWQQISGLLVAVSESLSVFVVGQSPPLGQTWPWAVATSLAVTLFFYAKPPASPDHPKAKLTVALYVFVPIGLIYLITLLLTPLYHVRYLFTYAPPFSLILAYVIDAYAKQFRTASLTTLPALLVISSVSLYEFWINPLYQTDDHRHAVATLAQDWRPGDSILVNAGWAYPPLAIYWPTELQGALSYRPPSLAEITRLGDWKGSSLPSATRTGSIDGAANLGWGDPASDFFAISSEETIQALTHIADQSASIWHYRIYDTVSDPNGIIRIWLDKLTLAGDQPYPGRDYLRVQHFITDESKRFQLPDYSKQAIPTSVPPPTFGKLLTLVGNSVPHSISSISSVQAGEELYLLLDWLSQADLSSLGVNLRMSLRLYDPENNLVAQHDEAPLTATNDWQAKHHYTQTMALGIPVATKPGRYSLQLIVYRQDNGEALSLAESPSIVEGQRYQVTEIDVSSAQQIPEIGSIVASFDYIELLSATPGRTQAVAGDTLAMELIWRAQPSSYRDSYAAQIELVDANGSSVQTWRRLIGGDDFPSSQWSALIPVREFRNLQLDPTVAKGTYTVRLRLERNSDQTPIPARQGWGWFKQDSIAISAIEIQ